MKLVTINNALLLKYNGDSEILQKSTRPYVLVIRLKYKGLNYDFAVPIRSNIPASAPKNQYFALPPRPQTRPKNRHGLHYIKMFPVTKQYLVRYRTEGNNFAMLIQTKTASRLLTNVNATSIYTVRELNLIIQQILTILLNNSTCKSYFFIFSPILLSRTPLVSPLWHQ